MHFTLNTRRALLVLLATTVLAAGVAGCGRKKAETPAPAPAPVAATPAPTQPATAAVKPDASAVATPEMSPAPADTLEPPSYADYEPLPILTYHQVNPKVATDITISPANFDAQMKWLKSQGYSTISSAELVKHHEEGTPLPAKPVMITFDDGWKDQYVYAAPILEKYGFNAVFFIYPKMIGNGGAFMTRDQVVDLDKRGFDIQSHTWGHVSLVHKAETSFRGFERWTRPQFTQTADWTEKYIGKKPIALAYPYGYYDLDIIGILQGNDVKLAFTVDEGVSDARAWDRLALKRFTITRGGSLTQFANRITGTPFPARDIQPPPGSRLKSRSATITADISELPRDVSGISFAGSSLGETTIIKKDGKRYAVARLKNGKPGFHYITLRGAGADGKKYLSSWSMVLGN